MMKTILDVNTEIQELAEKEGFLRNRELAEILKRELQEARRRLGTLPEYRDEDDLHFSQWRSFGPDYEDDYGY